MSLLKKNNEKQIEALEAKLNNSDTLLKRVDRQINTFNHFRALLVQERNDLIVSMRKLEVA